MFKKLFNFLLGILLYIAIVFFKEGTNWLAESQDSGGKEMGAMAEWMYGVLLMLVFGTIVFKIFVYIFKLLRSEGNSSIAKLLPLIIGFIVTPLIHKAYKDYKITEIVHLHLINHGLATDYVANEFTSYKDIYQIVIDSTDKWISDSLGVIIKEIRSNPNISVDSLIVFNSERNRFKATTYYSYKLPRRRYNTGYRNIYGLKHDQEWTLIPDWNSHASLIAGLYDMKSSEYPLERLTIMNRVYKIKGDLKPTQIQFPMLNGTRNRTHFKFDSLDITEQKYKVDSLFAMYKTSGLNEYYYDLSDRYKKDWRYKRKLKKAKKINKQLFAQMND